MLSEPERRSQRGDGDDDDDDGPVRVSLRLPHAHSHVCDQHERPISDTRRPVSLKQHRSQGGRIELLHYFFVCSPAPSCPRPERRWTFIHTYLTLATTTFCGYPNTRWQTDTGSPYRGTFLASRDLSSRPRNTASDKVRLSSHSCRSSRFCTLVTLINPHTSIAGALRQLFFIIEDGSGQSGS